MTSQNFCLEGFPLDEHTKNTSFFNGRIPLHFNRNAKNSSAIQVRGELVKL